MFFDRELAKKKKGCRIRARKRESEIERDRVRELSHFKNFLVSNSISNGHCFVQILLVYIVHIEHIHSQQ